MKFKKLRKNVDICRRFFSDGMIALEGIRYALKEVADMPASVVESLNIDLDYIEYVLCKGLEL